MKKLMMLAVASALSISAFAQDVYKQISKIKDYNEAYNLLKSNLGSMSAEEKAKCYNALVDLAYAKIVKEQATVTENQMAEQLKTKVSPYDTVGLYNAALRAIENGVACDEFDMQPNEKGKVKPKFRKSNGDRLYPVRFHLINAGIYYQNRDAALAYKNFATYVDSNDYTLFGEQDKSRDQSLMQVAYYAARFAYFAKDFANAEKYADIAIKDTAVAQDALQLKLAVMQEQLKSREDSVKYVEKLKGIYAGNENNDMVFSMICSMMFSLNDKAGLDGFVQSKLSKDPNNFTALVMKGQVSMNDRKWDDAIADFLKAVEVRPDYVPVLGSVGSCYRYKAQETAERASANGKRISPEAESMIIDIYKKGIEYLDKAKNLDSTMQFKSYWAYSLYACCYSVYGADDPKTKEAEALTK